MSSPDNPLLANVDAIIDKHGGEASSLIQVLLEVQREYHWVPAQALGRVAARLDLPMSQVRHVATFYKAFSLVPRGRHQVHVCTGSACHARGAAKVLDKVKEVTGVGPGETDVELKFSVESASCLGVCALGPVMEVDGETRGNLTPDRTAELLSSRE